MALLFHKPAKSHQFWKCGFVRIYKTYFVYARMTAIKKSQRLSFIVTHFSWKDFFYDSTHTHTHTFRCFNFTGQFENKFKKNKQMTTKSQMHIP